MIAFLTILYIALVVLIFRVLKVKPRPWPIAGMATLGVLLILGVVIFWTIAAPITSRAVVSRYVVQLVPYVKGQVIEIPARPNVPLKKGDVLYRIDPAPYQYVVRQVEAELQAANSNVDQLVAGVAVAEANVAKAQAEAASAKASLDVAQGIQADDPSAISKLKLVQTEQDYAAATAGLNQVQAAQTQATAALQAARDTVVSIQAELDTANFNLAECTVTAPADGFVTDWQIREGTFVVAMPFAAAGTFVETSTTRIAAAFPAQMLMHVKPDQPVELAFKSQPGRLLRGSVESVIQATGEGQYETSGKLPSASQIGSPGYLAVMIRLDDDVLADELEMGTPGTVAIYTDWGKPFDMISKVAIRMKKWLYFLPLPGL
ncbi:MAG: efflux RND transporter periplasmic adaptor subunit [Pirellulales bacterium]